MTQNKINAESLLINFLKINKMDTEQVTMNMAMTLAWKVECSFIFEDWSTVNVFPFIIGCILSGFVAGITIALPFLKHKILPSSIKQSMKSSSLLTEEEKVKNENVVLKAVYYLIYSTLHIATMLLIMTMNGYVIIVMLVFMTLSYFFFGGKDYDSNMPVNCCAGQA